MVDHATLEESLDDDIDLGSNAFLMAHGYTCGALLLEFVRNLVEPLRKGPLTLGEIASKVGAKLGPLGITLRSCAILGYVDFHSETGSYTLVPGQDLDELCRILSVGQPAAEALRSVYEVAVPFPMYSKSAEKCLAVWGQHRATWRASKSRALAVLLDGVVLAPVLTSITYFARWNESGLDYGKDVGSMDTFDFSSLASEFRTSLGQIFQEVGVGTMDEEGFVQTSTSGPLALQRCFSFYCPTSYSPMLYNFNHILFKDAGWGFVGTGQDTAETEIHVNRTLNVVGSGAQHRTFFKHLMRHIDTIFSGEDFASQPRFVVDTGSGDGHLLMTVYEYVRLHTPRGQVFNKFPLTMVGVDYNEESRIATAVNLAKLDIPFTVLFGDIGRPDNIVAALKKRHIEQQHTLHVRSFLDHDRPYIAPLNNLEEDSVAAKFAKEQMSDFVHVDKYGEPIAPLEVFQSLVEHFGRWGDAIDGSFGLCMLEVMMLDIPTTKRFFNDNVSFHFDIVECLSRQYMISAVAFAMAAAMAGLLPANMKNVQTYPEQGKYCRVMNQHLVRRPFKVRFAAVADQADLVRLENQAWDANLCGGEQVVKKRLETSPTSNLVCEIDGKVVAVIYMQRIAEIETVFTEKSKEESEAHDPSGRIIQILGLFTDQGNAGVGSELRAFALHLARLDPSTDSVVGVTRARDFKGYSGTMQEYVACHTQGTLVDPIIDFHTSYGAQVVSLVPGFRPEDVDNEGCGVLIQYHVKELAAKRSAVAGPACTAASGMPSHEVIRAIMAEVGYEIQESDYDKGFFDFGMDSLELVRIRNRVGSALGMELGATLLIDFPSVRSLAEHLDKERPSIKVVKTLDVLTDIMKGIGCPIDDGSIDTGFFDFGMDSLELVRVRQQLGASLGMELPATLLLDFPTVRGVAEHLDKQRGVDDDSVGKVSAEPKSMHQRAAQPKSMPSGYGAAQARATQPHGGQIKKLNSKQKLRTWEDVDVGELIQMQTELRSTLKSVEYQQIFDELKKKCRPNAQDYLLQLDPIIREAEAAIFLRMGLVSDTSTKIVEECRQQMVLYIKSHWNNTQVRSRGLELIRIAGVSVIDEWEPQKVSAARMFDLIMRE